MKILANDGMAQAGIDVLERAGHTVLTTKVAQEHLANYIQEQGIEVLLVRSATTARQELIDACPGLRMIGRGGVGMDNIDVDYARAQGRFVFNTPAASSESVAELVFAHLGGMLRFLPDANRLMPLEGETRFNDLKKAYAGVDDSVKLLISHDPTHWDEKVTKGYPDIQITFSGHTHGAQMGFEIGKYRWSPIQLRYNICYTFL